MPSVVVEAECFMHERQIGLGLKRLFEHWLGLFHSIVMGEKIAP